MTLLPVWFKGLTPELQWKAEAELGETPAVKERALRELRSLINKQHEINCRQDDLFLLRFLRTKKYDVQKSFNVLRKYYAMRAKHWGTLIGKTPSELMNILDMNNVGCAPHRMASGSHVGMCLVGRFDPGKASADDLIATGFMFGELVLECEASQISGGVYIIDMKGLSFLHYVRFLTRSFISLCISLIQDCWPDRIKGIHFVNEPYLLHALRRMIRPMLKPKLNERLFFHGSDLSSLHIHVPKEFLPEELGGTRGPLDNSEEKAYLISQESYIQSNNKYGIIGKTSK